VKLVHLVGFIIKKDFDCLVYFLCNLITKGPTGRAI